MNRGVRRIGERKLDFERALASDSIKSHSAAAVFLRAEGKDGYRHLPRLLECCKAVDLTQTELSKIEENLVGCGARTLAAIVNGVGYDESDPLHHAVADWLLHLTNNQHVQIAAYSIYAIGDLGIPPEAIRCRLEELINTDLRADDHGVITCRAIAFRCLAGINRALARPYVDSHACAEFISAIDHWSTQYPDNIRRRNELIDEIDWLRQQ
jgi:hypothetical protein